MTEVVFRKTKEGYIDAIFPYDLATYDLTMTCYSRIGQHSSACPLWVYHETKPATPEEAESLKRELISIGYTDLKVLDRLPPFSKAMARLKQERDNEVV